MRTLRVIAAVALVLAGLATALFFLALYGIADCGPDCSARGEHAPVVALIAAGIGLVATGCLLHRGWRVALIWGGGTAGTLTCAGSAWAAAMGEGGWIWASAGAGLAIALACILVGRRKPDAGQRKGNSGRLD